MSGIASEAYRRHSLNRKIEWSSGQKISFQSSEWAYDYAAPADAILRSASNSEAISQANDRAKAQLYGGGGRQDDALYIIHEVGGSEACKIGFSFRPVDRLAQFQIGTWRPLEIAALFYPVKAKIELMERAVHDLAKERGQVLTGEWLNLTVAGAVALIMEVAERRTRLLCGADVWYENLAARVAGLRKEQLAMQQRIAA